MSKQSDVIIHLFGKDLRLKYLGIYLRDRGYVVEEIEGAEIRIVVESKNSPLCLSLGDFLKDSSFAFANSALTAEGFLSILIQETPFSLVGGQVLLLGFGRCGMEIGKLLRLFDMKVFAVDQEESCLTSALNFGLIPATFEELRFESWDYDVVINTVPSRILSKEQLESLPEDCILFDIASAPFGFDLAEVEALGRKLVQAPGIPGRYMAKSAGVLMGTALVEMLSARSKNLSDSLKERD